MYKNAASRLLIAAAMLITLGIAGTPTSEAGSVFNFSGVSAGGTGSATVDSTIVGNTMTWLIDNTSPILLNDLSGPNSPAILGLGFNLNPNRNLVSWVLKALPLPTSSYPGDLVDISSFWQVNQTVQGVTLDFIVNNGAGVQEGLYNPNATSPGPSPYYTRAELTMTFDGAPVLDLTDPNNGGVTFPDGTASGDRTSLYVRMQRVGTGGSLKLGGTPGGGGGGGGNPVPEPHALLLAGLGAVLSLRTWKRRNNLP